MERSVTNVNDLHVVLAYTMIRTVQVATFLATFRCPAVMASKCSTKFRRRTTSGIGNVMKILRVSVVPWESAARKMMTAVINSGILTPFISPLVPWMIGLAVVLESAPTPLGDKAATLGLCRGRRRVTVVPRESAARRTTTAALKVHSEILPTVNWTLTAVVLDSAPSPLGDNSAILGIRCRTIPAFPRLVILVGAV